MLDPQLSSWLYVSSVIDVAQDKSLPCMACCFLNSKARDFSHHELFPSTRPPVIYTEWEGSQLSNLVECWLSEVPSPNIIYLMT